MDGVLGDALRAALLLGLALLAWREFREIRTRIAERKRRDGDDSNQS